MFAKIHLRRKRHFCLIYMISMSLSMWIWADCLSQISWAQMQSRNTEEVLIPRKVYQVKYAMLYSFGISTSLVNPMPETASQREFVIAVVGGKFYPEYLQHIASSKKIQGRSVLIRWVQSPEDVDDCDLVYIQKESSQELEAKILKRLAKKPVVVVGEHQGSLDDYVVNLVVVDGTIRFEINSEAARTRKLQIDPRLSRLAIPASVRQPNLSNNPS